MSYPTRTRRIIVKYKLFITRFFSQNVFSMRPFTAFHTIREGLLLVPDQRHALNS